MIPRTASNGMTFYETTTIIERVFGYEIAESVIVATNSFALPGVERVTKNGYVTVKNDNGYMTVSFSELGLAGSADDNLGKSIRLVYKNDDKAKLITVLGSTELGRVEVIEKLGFGDKNSHVEIGGVKYQVVEKLSDALSTNSNELLVYAYDNDGILTQITSNSDLAALTGAFNASLIFDDKDSETADRLIIKPFSLGQYRINGGRINIAGNLKLTDTTIKGDAQPSNGDHVLYYFNETNKTLEISSILPISGLGTVTRLTPTTATIGGVKYDLGNSKLGISASDIHSKLNVGANVRVVTLNGAIVAIASASDAVYSPSSYLIAESNPIAVFVNGKLGYMLEANIGGVSQEIFVTNKTIEVGKVYRYITDGADNYTLIPARLSNGVIVSGSSEFVQSDKLSNELAYIIESAKDSSVIKSGSHYVISAGSSSAMTSSGVGGSTVSFVTDQSSMIVVKTANGYQVVSGRFNSSLKINDGAYIAAIFANEPGSVETLRYLYISDGSIGSVASSASSVKVLALTGRELIDGRVYTSYSVLKFATGKLESMLSLEADLTVGKNYLIDLSGLISSEEASANGGVVTGYTKSTITIGGETYTIDSNTIIARLEKNGSVSSASHSDLYMKNVEITSSNGVLGSIIILGEPSFDVSYENGSVKITANEKLSGLGSVELVSLSKRVDDKTIELDISDFKVSYSEKNGFELTIAIHATSALESGSYTVEFTLDDTSAAVGFTVK